MDFPVLKYIDVLIGFSFVMLVIATVALTISQLLMNLMAARVRHLTNGLEQLIRQLHPQLLDAHANYIAKVVLRHPLVGRPPGFGSRLRALLLKPWHWLSGRERKVPTTLPGNVIQRGELAFCLLEWAAGDGPLDLPFDPQRPDPPGAGVQARTALAHALKFRGIEDPLATFRAVKLQALANEKDKPEQASHLWRSQALAQVAPSDALATIHQYFDATMARVTASFGTEAQIWVSAIAFVVVGILQFDAIQLVKRLSVDDTYRATLVAEAQRLKDAGAPPVDSLAGTNCEAIADQKTKDQCLLKASLNLLQSPTLDIWPAQRPPVTPRGVVGMLIAWLLVSLGAPFWYDLIKNLFNLRSVLAQKEEGDRGRREGTTKATEPPPPNPGQPAGPPTPPAAGAKPNTAGGEVGDLQATGTPA